MVDIETPDAKKNGTGGTLIHSKVKLLPLGPAGPFVLQGFMIGMEESGPQPLGHMTFQADSLALLEHGLRGFQQAYAAAMKALLEEFNAAKLMTQHDATTVARINKTKGS
jgi:hypothetical protein